MAYTRPITRPKCILCAAHATVTVVNARNAPAGDYCARCGKRRLQQLQRLENEDHERERQRRAETDPNGF